MLLALDGGACITGDYSKQTGGKWSKDEAKEHINYLELLAAWFGIQCFAKGRTSFLHQNPY